MNPHFFTAPFDVTSLLVTSTHQSKTASREAGGFMMQRSVEELVWKDLVLSFFRFSLYTFLKKENYCPPTI